MINRIAVISDIHGNIPALEAVVEDIKGRNIDQIVCLGDLAGKGPNPCEAVDFIKEYCDVVVKGNWEYLLTEKNDNILLTWQQDKLGDQRLEYLKSLPDYIEFYMSGKLIRLCHASPNDVFHRVHISTEEEKRLQLFKPTKTLDQEADVVGYGDIHGAYVDHISDKTLFNTGSVGNPLDLPQSSYAIIEGKYESKEPSSFGITIVRVPYNIEEAVQDAINSEMPETEAYIDELRTAIYRYNKA